MKKNLPNLLIEKEKSRPDELTYAEHSEEEHTSSSKSEDSCHVPSTSKENVFQLKRRIEVPLKSLDPMKKYCQIF